MSIYDKYWLHIKANPNKYITYNVPEHMQLKFMRGVRKRKYRDNSLKAKYPFSRIKFRFYEGGIVKVILVLNTSLPLL